MQCLLDPDNETPLNEQVAALRRRVAELEQELAEAQRRPGAALREERPAGQEQGPLASFFSADASGHAALLDAIPAMVFFKDRDHRYLAVNKAYAAHYRLSIDRIVGKRDEEIFVEEVARSYHDNDEILMSEGIPRLNVELRWKLEDGSDGWTLENNVPFRDASGRVIGMVGVVVDMTARKRMEEALRSTEADLLSIQSRLLETITALSTPVMPIDHGVIVMPLIGHLDTMRGTQLMAALLQGVERHDAEFVIVDLTGVPMIDSAVALHLLRAVQAVRLLGAQCVLVGMSASTAASLAAIGETLEELVLLRDLRAGVRYAMARRRAMARAHRRAHP
ncbi:PAS domain-containing protein [Sorangium sp. So ce1000]|uniref:PAS domain-containing protein n=1 Tax=Sorangium sp. So ce1000 TaxID=3133325 RepID=UPI003F62372C